MSVSLFLFVEKFICVIKNVLNRDRHWNFAASNTETPELGVCKKIIHMYGQLERITAWLSWKNYCLEECWYCSVTKPCPNLCDPMNCSMPGLSVLHYLPEFAQTHVHWVIDAIQSFHPLSPSPPALIFPCIRISSNESALRIRWPNYWSFSISLSSEYSGFIFFGIHWSDFLAVRGTLKILLQHCNSKYQAWKNKVAFFFSFIYLFVLFFICGLSEPHLC